MQFSHYLMGLETDFTLFLNSLISIVVDGIEYSIRYDNRLFKRGRTKNVLNFELEQLDKNLHIIDYCAIVQGDDESGFSLVRMNEKDREHTREYLNYLIEQNEVTNE